MYYVDGYIDNDMDHKIREVPELLGWVKDRGDDGFLE
jgi:hypothetical protein